MKRIFYACCPFCFVGQIVISVGGGFLICHFTWPYIAPIIHWLATH